MEKTSSTSNWKYGTLGDVVDKGSSNISLNKVKDDDGEYPLFSAKGFNKNISFFHQEKEYLAIIKDGAGIGRVSQHPAKSSVVGTMQYLIPKEGFDIGFIRYFLTGIDFENHRQGSTIPHVYFKDYKSEPFPLLPLPQQKQIVAILDKVFAGINTAKMNAEQNLQNVKELFESYLHNVFENKGDDWEEVLIGEVSELIDSLHQTPTYSDSGYAMVRVTEIKGGYLKTEKALRVNESVYNEFSKRHKPKDGDIIMSRVGASFGVCAFVHNNELFCLGQNTVFIIPKINPTLMFYFLKSPVAREQMNNLASGSAQPTISLKSIKAIKMNLPPVEKQQEIVRKIDVLFDKCKKLEAIYTQKIADLEETKKSILQKAFSGELNTLN